LESRSELGQENGAILLPRRREVSELKKRVCSVICVMLLASANQAQDKKESAGGETPKPAVSLKAGTFHYTAKLEMNGQEMLLKMTTTIEDDGSAWTATDVMETPQGSGTDTATIDKGSLTLVKRTLRQGPVTISLDYAGNKAAGTANINGQDHAIAVDLGGPLFADAAGAEQVIACLPLAPGYAVKVRNFDVQTQTVKIRQITVTTVEKVTVPAGTFDAYRVDETSTEGDPDRKTIWIATDSRKVVKMSLLLAALGGAVMTVEAVD
jgi:hypothetical protein